MVDFSIHHEEMRRQKTAHSFGINILLRVKNVAEHFVADLDDFVLSTHLTWTESQYSFHEMLRSLKAYCMCRIPKLNKNALVITAISKRDCGFVLFFYRNLGNWKKKIKDDIKIYS